MKMKHNKKRNTAFIYEILIKELSKASMQNIEEKKNVAINLLKTFFSKGSILREELDIYQSFEDISDHDVATVEKIIMEARRQADKLNHDEISRAKSKLINLINKNLGPSSWDNFIKNYKHIATVNQAVFTKSSPKKQIFLQEKLINSLTGNREEKKQFPAINKLTLKTFLEKFNNTYGENLNERQKALLNKYVMSYEDNGLELKTFLYEEIDNLKDKMLSAINKKDGNHKKYHLIKEKIENYSNRKIDRNMIIEIIKIQSLVEEINNGIKIKNKN